MRIRKAVITAAAPGQRDLPLQTLIDRDGVRKSVLALQIAEMIAAGAEEVCVIIAPDAGDASRSAAAEYAGQVRFVPQAEPRGYGHAVWCAREFVAGEPFLHQVGDHLFVGAVGMPPAAAQIAAVARENECAVSGVQPTRESLLTSFGAIGGLRVRGEGDLYAIERVAEKPTPTEAEQSLLIPGLRAGYYLCFMGTHVLTPAVMESLDAAMRDESGKIGLTPALNALSQREKYLAVAVQGRRYHLDVRYGLLQAQLALALSGEDRDTVLTELVSLLAKN